MPPAQDHRTSSSRHSETGRLREDKGGRAWVGVLGQRTGLSFTALTSRLSVIRVPT